MKLKILIGVMVLCLLVIASALYLDGCKRAVNEKVSACVLDELNKHFLLQEVLSLAGGRGDRAGVEKYFAAHRNRFLFSGSETQDEMLVDGYQVIDNPLLIGISLFFYGDQQKLVMLNVAIQPQADEYALKLINQSISSVDAPGRGISSAAKLYFLGLSAIDNTRLLKIMLRKDILPSGELYSINYAISGS